jgi:hypothetical protein
MAWRKEDGAIFRYVEFAQESLVKIDDVELAALKIHVVVEDMLKFLLAARLGVDEGYFFDQRDRFATLATRINTVRKPLRTIDACQSRV